VLLYSDSGTGKSSLVNAGLLPGALAEGFQAERIRVQPRRGEEIVIQLSEKVGNDSISYPSIFTSDRKLERLVLSVEDFQARVRRHAGQVRPLLVFDQFEEWVTLFEQVGRAGAAKDARESQEKIQNVICSLINDSRLPVKVLISLREDYLAKLTPFFRQCPNLPDQYLRLVPLKGDQIFQAIRGPFQKYPGRFRPELGEPLAKEIQSEFENRSVGTDIRLTEVQIVCRNLFEAGDEDPSAMFAGAGGVLGILERYLEQAVESLGSDQREPAIALLSRMVTPAGTRDLVSQDNLCWRVESEDRIPRELLEQTLNSLEQKAKLVRRERRREVYYYEIASEFLVGWIGKKAQERQREIDRKKLVEAQRLAYAQEQARQAEQLRQALATAKRAEALARSRELIASSLLSQDVDPELSVLLAAHAVAATWPWERTVFLEAENQLHRAILASHVRLALSGHSESLYSVAWSPGGKRLATGSHDNTAKVWDAETGMELLTLSGHTGSVSSVAWSLDGKRLATGSWDNTAKVWDAETGMELLTLSGHTGSVSSVAWSLDGKRLATGSWDNTARV